MEIVKMFSESGLWSSEVYFGIVYCGVTGVRATRSNVKTINKIFPSKATAMTYIHCIVFLILFSEAESFLVNNMILLFSLYPLDCKTHRYYLLSIHLSTYHFIYRIRHDSYWLETRILTFLTIFSIFRKVGKFTPWLIYEKEVHKCLMELHLFLK